VQPVTLERLFFFVHAARVSQGAIKALLSLDERYLACMQHAIVEDTYIPVSGHMYSRMRYLACMQHAVVEDTCTSIRTQIL
jgi:hypothetical protein